jgi:tetratricopeptide (TPR) repeat protein
MKFCGTFLWLCFLLYNHIPAFAQKTSKLDSLYQKFNISKIDTQKVNILNKIYPIHYKTQKYDSALVVLQKSYELAEKIQYEAGLAATCENMASVYRKQNNFVTAIKYALQASELRRKLGNKKDFARILFTLGLIYFDKSEYQTALKYYKEALSLAQETKSKQNEGNIYHSMGLLYRTQRNSAEALNSYQKALKIREELADTQAQAETYVSMAYIYRGMEDYQKQLEMQQKALAMFSEDNLAGKMSGFMGIGITYSDLKNYPKAVENYKKAQEFAVKIGDKKNISNILTNLANAYNNLGDTSKALASWNEAYKIKLEIDDKQGLAITLTNIGKYYVKYKQPHKGIEYLKKSFDLAQKIGLKATLRSSSETLADAYIQLKDYEQAYKYKEIYTTYEDSISSESVSKKLQALEFDYALEKKEKEILLLQKDKNLESAENDRKQQQILLLTQTQVLKTQELQLLEQEKRTQEAEASKQEQQISLLNKDKEIQKTNINLLKQEQLLRAEESKIQQFIGLGLAIGVVFLLLLAGLFYRSKQNTQKANRVLSDKNVQIELQRTEIAEKNGEMKQINEEMQATLQVVANQNEELARKNKDIFASIAYAKRIQDAMLPLEEEIAKGFGKENFFILFKPRDIVSGDFYWFQEIPANFNSTNSNPLLIMAVADCTGHGIPGAFMSMIGNEVLNQIINIDKQTSPDLILSQLSMGICNALKQDVTNNRDGMDMSVITIDKTAKVFEYSGAMNPMFVFANGELALTETKSTVKHKINNSNELVAIPTLDFWELKADKIPIGGKSMFENEIFSKQTIPYIENETTLYLLSDGYQDQFGGKEQRKFMVKRLRELLISIQTMGLNSQQKILNNTISQWIAEGNQHQTDDITVVGIRI